MLVIANGSSPTQRQTQLSRQYNPQVTLDFETGRNTKGTFLRFLIHWLKWKDLDLNPGILRVKRQIFRINGKVVEAPLKTKNAYRTLPLAEDTIDVLNMQRKKANGSEWVFPSPDGGPISPDSVLHKLHRVLKRAGLPEVRFHDLRHTFATLALQNGDVCERCLWQMKRAKRSGSRTYGGRKYLERPGSVMRQQG